MESYALPTPAYPAELAEISFALFVNMEGSAALRQRLIKASTMEGDEGITERQRVDFAFLDAKMVRLTRQDIWQVNLHRLTTFVFGLLLPCNLVTLRSLPGIGCSLLRISLSWPQRRASFKRRRSTQKSSAI